MAGLGQESPARQLIAFHGLGLGVWVTEGLTIMPVGLQFPCRMNSPELCDSVIRSFLAPPPFQHLLFKFLLLNASSSCPDPSTK